jgi:hypothetical protein
MINFNLNINTMKKQSALKSYLYLIMVAIVFASCDCYEDPGIVINESRELTEFDALNIETVGKINLYAAEEFKIIIKTHINIIDDIVTNVIDNKLTIRLTGNHNRIRTLELDIFAPTYTLIEQNDVAKITCNDGFTATELSIIQNDVGDIHLFNLNIESLFIELKDVGDVELTGRANTVTASLDGVGEIHLFDMVSKSAELDLSGTGDIEINASESLGVHLSGVGSVYYKGSPNISIDKTGVGEVVNVN